MLAALVISLVFAWVNRIFREEAKPHAR